MTYSKEMLNKASVNGEWIQESINSKIFKRITDNCSLPHSQ